MSRSEHDEVAATAHEVHNRWHPDLEPVAKIRPGQSVRLVLRDALDGQLPHGSTVEALQTVDFARAHPLTGPIWVEGADPGDLLEIETLSLETASFGWTLVKPGGGLLGDDFSEHFLVIWEIEGGVARSADLPGVRVQGAPFLGVMGVAPSTGRMKQFRARETALHDTGAVVALPTADGATSTLGHLASDGLRTQPPRETGGNLDIKNCGVGSKLVLPVDVPGALFSAGDLHFAQGDGESCISAIEVSGSAVLRFRLVKQRDVAWRPRYPYLSYECKTTDIKGDYISVSGLPIDGNGRNLDCDLNVATKNAARELIEYLVACRGLNRLQAYVLLSVAADLRVSSVVNAPNVVVTAHLPLAVFDDASPSAGM
jgi:formamidase